MIVETRDEFTGHIITKEYLSDSECADQIMGVWGQGEEDDYEKCGGCSDVSCWDCYDPDGC